MKVLLLSQWFEPEPFFKGLPLALALRDRGHDVEVITGFPNYPGGRVYPGYKVTAYQREVLSGVLVHRVPLFPSHDRSSLRRTLNYSSFALAAAVVGIAVASRREVAYVYHPPASIGLAALAFKGLRGIPFVLDVNDLWPDTLAASGMVGSGAILGAIGLWCRLLYRVASRVTVVSPGFRDALVSRGVPPAKIELIYNWCDDCAGDVPLQGDLTASDPLPPGFNVVFAGNLGRAQGLGTVLDAATLLRDGDAGPRIIFIGSGVEETRLRARAAEQKLENVLFLGRLPPRRAMQVLRRADVLLVHLLDDPLFKITIPSKTQAYLASGRPILMGVRGDASELVRRAGAGLCFAPEDAAGMASGVRHLMSLSREQRDRMGLAGRQFYDSELSINVGLPRLEAALKAASGGRS